MSMRHPFLLHYTEFWFLSIVLCLFTFNSVSFKKKKNLAYQKAYEICCIFKTTHYTKKIAHISNRCTNVHHITKFHAYQQRIARKISRAAQQHVFWLWLWEEGTLKWSSWPRSGGERERTADPWHVKTLATWCIISGILYHLCAPCSYTSSHVHAVCP